MHEPLARHVLTGCSSRSSLIRLRCSCWVVIAAAATEAAAARVANVGMVAALGRRSRQAKLATAFAMPTVASGAAMTATTGDAIISAVVGDDFCSGIRFRRF